MRTYWLIDKRWLIIRERKQNIWPRPLHVLHRNTCPFLFTLCARGGANCDVWGNGVAGSEREHVGLVPSASRRPAGHHKPGCRGSTDGDKTPNQHVDHSDRLSFEDFPFPLSGGHRFFHLNTSQMTGGGTPMSQILLGADHDKSDRHPSQLGHSLVSSSGRSVTPPASA